MRFRKLRIAWSVGCGVLAVVLIALWVRSYYVGDVAQWSVTKWSGFQLTSMEGQLTARRCDLDGAGHHGGMDFPDWLWSQSPPGSFSKSPTTLGFEVRHLLYFVAFPYWAPISICTALAVAPILFGFQRPQFSVRTLLIATTLVAVVLGPIVWSTR